MIRNITELDACSPGVFLPAQRRRKKFPIRHLDCHGFRDLQIECEKSRIPSGAIARSDKLLILIYVRKRKTITKAITDSFDSTKVAECVRLKMLDLAAASDVACGRGPANQST